MVKSFFSQKPSWAHRRYRGFAVNLLDTINWTL